MAVGAAGQIGAHAAPRVVSASEDGTGVATHPGRPRTVTTATATTLTMTYALAPIVTVRLFKCHCLYLAFINAALRTNSHIIAY